LSLSIRDELWVKCFRLCHGRLRTGATPMFEGLDRTRLCSIGNNEIDMGLLLSKVLISFLRLITTNDYFQAGEQTEGDRSSQGKTGNSPCILFYGLHWLGQFQWAS
jgi:hypothetical protein